VRTSFLCPTHRSWLISEPLQAVNCWSREFETACIHYEQGDLRDALPHVGSAFETAGILLQVRVLEPAQAIRCFVQATSLLLDTLNKLHLHELYNEMHTSAVSALQQQAQRHRNLAPAIQFQLRRLSDRTATPADNAPHPESETHYAQPVHSRVLH
jgi:hypothetical protein